MEKPTQEQLVASHFEELARSWSDRYTSTLTFQQYNFIARRENVLALFDKTEGTYLDAGCGTGDFIPGLIARGGNIIALDLSSGMLEQTRARIMTFASPGRVQFTAGDVAKLGYRDESFDAIIGVGLLEYLRDVTVALREMYRALKPGGILIITVPNLASPFMAYETLVSHVRRLINLARTRATKQSRPRSFRHRHFIPWRLDRTLRRMGFKKLDATFCTYGLFAAERLSPFFLSLSRRLAPYSRTPAGVLGTNYIVKVQKPFRDQ
jgi:ubiquinone/menaquinone biosynthesis C-methylase UbiE